MVHLYPNETAYEVEFCTFPGETVAVRTLGADQIRPVPARAILHVRPLVA